MDTCVYQLDNLILVIDTVFVYEVVAIKKRVFDIKKKKDNSFLKCNVKYKRCTLEARKWKHFTLHKS